MKSFLVRNKRPIVSWGAITQGTFFEGEVPNGWDLAISPGDNYVVIDVDRHESRPDGFENIPHLIQMELYHTLQYKTKNNGVHYWCRYSGNKQLGNRSSGLGIDLRTNKGYVVWYPKEDIRTMLHLIKDSSETLNLWLEKLFSTAPQKKINKKLIK